MTGNADQAPPEELRERDQWICWRYQQRGDGKPAKVPVNPKAGKIDSATDAGTWTSYSTAVECHDGGDCTTDGVGFVFTEDDRILGVDLDDCVSEDGELEAWAREIVDTLDSYTESSPSGKGLHIILKSRLPGEKNRRGDVEMYESGRFFTVTGDHLGGTPTTVNGKMPSLMDVYEEHLGSEAETTDNDTGAPRRGGLTQADIESFDEDIISRAKSATNGEKFRRLWNGDTSGYDSHSEADAALCSMLAFWTQKNGRQIDRLFRESGLMRPKWDEQRGDQTYGEMTIENAVRNTSNVYDPNLHDRTRHTGPPGANMNPTRRHTEESAAYLERRLRKAGTGNSTPACDEQTTDEPKGDLQLADVERVIRKEFDEETWRATGAVLAAHTTLLLKGSTGTGLVLVGPSSSGKTTVLEFIEELDDVYRSDDVTPASFVSADASREEAELAEIDLLPKIKQRSLLSRDMGTWFNGDQEKVYGRMSIMADLLDGKGYTRDTGTHGRRGYTGKGYRFNFLGASTPLSPRAWRAMGNVGTRLVFFERRGSSDAESVVDDIINGGDYHEKVDRCRSTVQDFLGQVWDDTGGYASVEKLPPASEDVENLLGYFVKLVPHARAVLEDEMVRREGGSRIGATLYDIAQGRALLDGRREVTVGDMGLVARIALSSMPVKRRPVVRALIDPANDGQLTGAQMEQAAGVSRPTAHRRMQELETLGLATCREQETDERETKVVELRPQFQWPGGLDFPRV